VKLQKGDVVTIEFDNNLRNVIPANVKINRIRHDLCWEDVVRDFANDTQLNGSPPPPFYHLLSSPSRFCHILKYVTELSQKVVGTHAVVPVGFWTSEKGKNMRAEFEKFARSRNFDPLVAEGWYNVPGQAFLKSPVCSMRGCHWAGLRNLN
jgi:hypothetical protein